MADMQKEGQTFVCDVETGDVVAFNLKPDLKTGQTAHEQLAQMCDIPPEVAIGGSIKANGHVELRSESLNNTNLGRCDASGTLLGEMVREKVQEGDYVDLDAILKGATGHRMPPTAPTQALRSSARSSAPKAPAQAPRSSAPKASAQAPRSSAPTLPILLGRMPLDNYNPSPIASPRGLNRVASPQGLNRVASPRGLNRVASPRGLGSLSGPSSFGFSMATSAPRAAAAVRGARAASPPSPVSSFRPSYATSIDSYGYSAPSARSQAPPVRSSYSGYPGAGGNGGGGSSYGYGGGKGGGRSSYGYGGGRFF